MTKIRGRPLTGQRLPKGDMESYREKKKKMEKKIRINLEEEQSMTQHAVDIDANTLVMLAYRSHIPGLCDGVVWIDDDGYISSSSVGGGTMREIYRISREEQFTRCELFTPAEIAEMRRLRYPAPVYAIWTSRSMIERKVAAHLRVNARRVEDALRELKKGGEMKGEGRREKMEKKIKINGDEIAIGDAIEMWLDAGVCRACINYRININKRYQDSYSDFAHMHCEECMCD